MHGKHSLQARVERLQLFSVLFAEDPACEGQGVAHGCKGCAWKDVLLMPRRKDAASRKQIDQYDFVRSRKCIHYECLQITLKYLNLYFKPRLGRAYTQTIIRKTGNCSVRF